MDLSKAADNALRELQLSGIGYRPIYFIAHDVGGLIVKCLLRISDMSLSRPEQRRVSEQCLAVTFLGTPHQGSQVGDFINAWILKPVYRPSEILKEIRSDSELLAELYRWYREYANLHQVITRSFFSLQDMANIVFEFSADPGVTGPYAISPIAVNKRHADICKPNDRSDLVSLDSEEVIRYILAQKQFSLSRNQKSQAFTNNQPMLESGNYMPIGSAEKLGHHKTIKIFLASSSELKEDRDTFDLYLRRENDRLLSDGVYLQTIRWEDFLDCMSNTRLQDEYNKEVIDCDIFVSLFKTKTGKYTEEEFLAAHRAFQCFGRPLIYTYFMQADVSNDKSQKEALNSLWSFQEQLSNLGHYYTNYSSVDNLLLHFRGQLDKLLNLKKL